MKNTAGVATAAGAQSPRERPTAIQKEERRPKSP